ncbi:hypothetical protein SFB22_07275 [Legionella pneumophila subsp. fraseri]|nr:hypothetical protein [Legionella pneumophila subsp. fraseri]
MIRKMREELLNTIISAISVERWAANKKKGQKNNGGTTKHFSSRLA